MNVIRTKQPLEIVISKGYFLYYYQCHRTSIQTLFLLANIIQRIEVINICKSYYDPKDGERKKDKYSKTIKNPVTFI